MSGGAALDGILYLVGDEFRTYELQSDSTLPVVLERVSMRESDFSDLALFNDLVYPNPIVGSSEVRYRTPATDHVRIAVYDVLGRQVALIVDAVQPAGAHRVQWNTPGLAGGTYLVSLEVGEYRKTRVATVVR